MFSSTSRFCATSTGVSHVPRPEHIFSLAQSLCLMHWTTDSMQTPRHVPLPVQFASAVQATFRSPVHARPLQRYCVDGSSRQLESSEQLRRA